MENNKIMNHTDERMDNAIFRTGRAQRCERMLATGISGALVATPEIIPTAYYRCIETAKHDIDKEWFAAVTWLFAALGVYPVRPYYYHPGK